MVVLEKAVCSKETAHKRTRSFGALDVEGELDATRYRENVTRWKTESLSAISHPVWQTMVAVSYNVREPLRHVRGFLMEVPRDSCKVGKLARLVWSKASCIASEFDELLDEGAWSEQVRVLPPSGSCCIWWLLLSNAANFDRRVVQMTRAFPMRLLWLARARSSTPMPSASTSRRRTHQYKPRLVGGHSCENSHSVLRSARFDPVDWMCQRGTVCVVLARLTPVKLKR